MEVPCQPPAAQRLRSELHERKLPSSRALGFPVVPLVKHSPAACQRGTDT